MGSEGGDIEEANTPGRAASSTIWHKDSCPSMLSWRHGESTPHSWLITQSRAKLQPFPRMVCPTFLSVFPDEKLSTRGEPRFGHSPSDVSPRGTG